MAKDLTEKTLRGWTDDIDPATIPDAVLWVEVGRRNSAKRKRHAGGRPRSQDLCPCGRMTPSRARLRRHVCDETTPKWRTESLNRKSL
jgi:hypothetical protein